MFCEAREPRAGSYLVDNGRYNLTCVAAFIVNDTVHSVGCPKAM